VAASTLRGSCHQCGSYLEASAPEDSPGTVYGVCSGAIVTTAGLPPACWTTSAIHLSRLSPDSNTTFAPAAACTSAGRGS
jgi:hypothetical protein